MPVHCSGRERRRPSAVPRPLAPLLSVLAALALLITLPGAADASYAPAKYPAHPAQDWMGVTVPDHERGQDERQGPRTASVEGVDVSSHNGNVSWSKLKKSGVRFAYTKATEGTSYTNPYFTQQYDGPYDAGMIRGAYHFALPDNSGGTTQADYFARHGGGWSRDHKTLPGVLDLEWNPYGDNCYGMSSDELIDWVSDFFDRYYRRTGREALLYTATKWWKECMGNYSRFGSVNPLWIPQYGSSVGELPRGWSFHTIWQYTDSGPTVGDHNRFNGSFSRLQALADG